jgi:hypothetical protein
MSEIDSLFKKKTHNDINRLILRNKSTKAGNTTRSSFFQSTIFNSEDSCLHKLVDSMNELISTLQTKYEITMLSIK